jgi:hypothetical protein
MSKVIQRAMAGTDAEWAAKLAKINKSKEVFKSGVTRSWEWREQQLKQFVKFLGWKPLYRLLFIKNQLRQ